MRALIGSLLPLSNDVLWRGLGNRDIDEFLAFYVILGILRYICVESFIVSSIVFNMFSGIIVYALRTTYPILLM